MKHTVELGDEVECKITGFKGTVIGLAKYLTGCDRAEVRGSLKKDGTMGEGYMFDIPVLKILKKQKVKPASVQVIEEGQPRKVGGPPTRTI